MQLPRFQVQKNRTIEIIFSNQGQKQNCIISIQESVWVVLKNAEQSEAKSAKRIFASKKLKF